MTVASAVPTGTAEKSHVTYELPSATTLRQTCSPAVTFSCPGARLLPRIVSVVSSYRLIVAGSTLVTCGPKNSIALRLSACAETHPDAVVTTTCAFHAPHGASGVTHVTALELTLSIDEHASVIALAGVRVPSRMLGENVMLTRSASDRPRFMPVISSASGALAPKRRGVTVEMTGRGTTVKLVGETATFVSVASTTGPECRCSGPVRHVTRVALTNVVSTHGTPPTVTSVRLDACGPKYWPPIVTVVPHSGPSLGDSELISGFGYGFTVRRNVLDRVRMPNAPPNSTCTETVTVPVLVRDGVNVRLPLNSVSQDRRQPAQA